VSGCSTEFWGRSKGAVEGDEPVASMSFANAESVAAFSAGSPVGSDQIYRRAMRHSRRVRRLRVVLLAAIAVILLGVVVFNYLPPIGGFSLPSGIGKLVIKGTEITMQNPHLTGFSSDSRPYQFSADTAAQDITKPDLVELHRLRAKMAMADKTTVQLWADDGLLNMKTEILTLNDNIRLLSSTGYEAHLSRTVIDMNKGQVDSNSPVEVKILSGLLHAKALQIRDKGAVVRFTGVTLTLLASPPKAKSP
jgi:lipopolysaccharide export system protein LptC